MFPSMAEKPAAGWRSSEELLPRANQATAGGKELLPRANQATAGGERQGCWQQRAPSRPVKAILPEHSKEERRPAGGGAKLLALAPPPAGQWQ